MVIDLDDYIWHKILFLLGALAASAFHWLMDWLGADILKLLRRAYDRCRNRR